MRPQGDAQLGAKDQHSIPLKPEIQGLRAVAVLTVLLFHVWPNALRGGYVGVDIFFVISGYLITGLLLREAEQTGTISLINFYKRRIRRLLPASTLVIAISCLFVGMLPKVQWEDTAWEALASSLYVQNWWLANQAIDYLAEDSAPSLLRHYWSLSVEEQYYILWPLLFLLFPAFHTANRSRHTFALIIGSVGGSSLLYSLYLTHHNPPLAYFATTTRAWELALGGGLAIIAGHLDKIDSKSRALLGWIGLCLIGLACVRFNQTTAFPGYKALLPALGAAFVIVAGQPTQPWSSYQLLKLGPMQYFGGISYSLYLWHWPVLTLYSAALPSHKITPLHGLAVVIISISLAHLSKRFVEDPLRFSNWNRLDWIQPPSRILALSIALAVITAGVVHLRWAKENGTPPVTVTLDPSILTKPYDPTRPTFPSLETARRDNPDVYNLKCHADQFTSAPLSCIFGNDSAQKKAVLIGDSHAAQWLPALQSLYRDKTEWKLITYTKTACPFNAASVTIGKERRAYESCVEWNQRVLAELKALRPNVVVTTQSAVHHALDAVNDQDSLRILTNGLRTRWDQLHELGAQVLVIRDTPWMERNIPECLSAPNATVTGCSTPIGAALRPDPILLAMQGSPPVNYLDITSQICNKTICSPIQGQVLVYRDSHHLTATFSRLMAKEISTILGPD